MNREPDRNRQDFSDRFDPSQYDMYAAFRTRERAEKRALKRRDGRSIYDVPRETRRPDAPGGIYRQGMRGASSAGNRTKTQPPRPNGSAGVYHIARNKTAANNNPGSYGNGGQNVRKHQQSEVAGAQNPANRTQQMPGRRPAGRTNPKQKAPVYGTRVNNTGDDAYRYGYHSSYRTADGRILEGFDKSGRPIYREGDVGGEGIVVQTTSAAVDAVRLHPVRRIRVETLEDTDKKPFPFLTVFAVILSTALVMGVLYTYMKLNEYSNTLTVLSYRLSNLRAETNTLSAEVVRREDLIAIEQTAADTLGMVKNDILTKRYVSIQNEDRTEIVHKTVKGEKKRVSVEINLDTGRPLTDEEKAAMEAKNK